MAVIISLVGSGASEPAGANKPAKASESPFSIGVIRPHLLAENLFGGNHNLSWKGRFQQVTLVAPLKFQLVRGRPPAVTKVILRNPQRL